MMFNPLFDIESLIKNEDYVAVYERLMLIRDFHVIFNKELVDEPTALQMFQCFSKEDLDLNVQDRQGKTFLMYACDNDYIGIIRYLCTHNADMELKDNDGNTAFDLVNNKKPLTVQNIKIKDALCDYYKPKKKIVTRTVLPTQVQSLQVPENASIFFKTKCKMEFIGRLPVFFYDHYEPSSGGYANAFSRLIWDYKNKMGNAIEAVTKIFIQVFNKDFTITGVPSSVVGNMSALPQVIKRLPQGYNIVDATCCLERVKSIQSAHHGGTRSAFLHKETIQLKDKELIKGKNVLLFDDIVTTGSSMSACCDILRQANPKSIVCFCLGRTVYRPNNY